MLRILPAVAVLPFIPASDFHIIAEDFSSVNDFFKFLAKFFFLLQISPFFALQTSLVSIEGAAFRLSLHPEG
jgi:hypothetical protein